MHFRENYNPNTGLEYLRARYYNAGKGRVFQEDTYLGDITDPLTLNRYAYVKNSPLNYIDPSGYRAKAMSYLEGSGSWPESANGGKNYPASETAPTGSTKLDGNIGALIGEVFGGLLAGAMIASAPVSLPVALFMIGVGAATGMAVGGTIQKDYETNLSLNDINRIQTMILENQIALIKLARVENISLIEYQRLQLSMASLESQLKQNICAIEDYQEDIESYQNMALSTVVVVGGVSITVQKLLEMSAQQGGSLNDIIKWAGNEGDSKADLYKDYALNATKNQASSEVVLGKFNQDGISYVTVAEQRKATYFQLDNWDEVVNAVGEANVWKINEQFLIQQLEQGKTFIFSHDPYKATGYFAKEVQFFIERGYEFIKSGDVWNAVLKR